VTVDPHLHRTHSLNGIFQLASCTHVHGAEALISYLRAEGLGKKKLVIVGPDVESAPWVRGIAGPLGLDSLVLMSRFLRLPAFRAQARTHYSSMIFARQERHFARRRLLLGRRARSPSRYTSRTPCVGPMTSKRCERRAWNA
jgi:phosphoribosylpyrophosphate synthetase